MEADEGSNRTAGGADRPTSNTVSSMRFGAYPALMAITERTFAVSLAGLFATLAHPDTYADWLVGGPTNTSARMRPRLWLPSGGCTSQ